MILRYVDNVLDAVWPRLAISTYLKGTATKHRAFESRELSTKQLQREPRIDVAPQDSRQEYDFRPGYGLTQGNREGGGNEQSLDPPLMHNTG